MKTLLRKVSALIAIAILFSSHGNFLSAQQSYFCGTDEIMTNLLKNNPEVQIAQQELEAFTKEYIRMHAPETSERGTAQYIIPIVFHIIHDRGAENISDNTIFQAVDILNKDYQKLNSDTNQVQTEFKPLIADVNVEFRLAQKDPNGNCTNGIDRVYSYRTYQGDDRGKVVVWDRKSYLNIWVVNRLADGNVAAYAYLPPGAAGLGYKVDGVIARYNYVGPDPVNGRTLTHEIGHSFNLMHPWGGGQVATACGDDGVQDTPETEGGTTCPSNKVDFTCDRDTVRRTYQFNNVTATSGTIDPDSISIINVHRPDTALVLTNFSAVGVSANSTADSVFAFSSWGTGGANGDTAFINQTGTMDLGKYYEFKVRPVFGQGMTLTGIRFNIKRNSTGVRMFAVRSSATVNFGSNLVAGVVPANPNISIRPTSIFYFLNDTATLQRGCRITLSGVPYTNTDNSITFRIYAWNAEDAAGTFEIDSVAVLGTFGTIENLDNYMDYTYCHHMFTIGQSVRMHAALESSVSSRNNLWSPENHILTGIDSPQTCPPQADFYVKKTMACQNSGQVQFFDYSSRGTVVSRTWTFPNGTPSTSTAQNPTVTFSTLWGQSATLTVTNSAGSTTITKDNVVWVAPPWPDYVGLFSEDFEDPSRFNTLWKVDNRYSTASNWEVTNTGTFASGSHGLRLNAFSPMVLSTNTTPTIILDPGIGSFDVDAFVTPSFDLSHITSGGQLKFKLSAGTRGTTPADMTDNLKVYYSTNCGNTWLPSAVSPLATYSGSTLCNAGSWQQAYVPTVSTQWVQKSITLPLPALAPNVRFKFEYTSGDLSNNIYIDDINISGIVGIEDNISSVTADLVVYPNPAGQDVSVSYRLSASRNIQLQVFDALGNLVYDMVNQKQAAGSYSVTFSTSRISNGVYYVKLSGDNVNLRTEKLVVIK
jgi:PKD repeat protein